MKPALLTFFFLIPFIASARVGLGETFFETPGGHQICDCDPYANTPVLVGHESSFYGLQTWYFYDDRIVGKAKDFYFIFDERTKSPQFFANETDWKTAVVAQHLSPVYTRWLTIHDAPERFSLVVLLSAFVWVPVLIGLGIMAAIWTKAKRFTFTKTTCMIAGSTLLFVAVVIVYKLNIHSF